MSAPLEVTVRQDEVDKRLDRLLVDRELGYSRSALQRWIMEGRVTVDGVRAKPKDKLRVGSVVCVIPAPPPPSDAVPQELPLDIVFEDDQLLVVNKPAGLVVHPAPGHPDGTLVNAIRFHTEIVGGSDPRRPGIVHRIDRDTSGLLVVAKTDVAREGLMAQFKAHTIEREYLAIVVGSITTKRSFNTLHGRHPVDRKRFTARVVRGRRAVTHVLPVAALPGATLLRCTLETGRTHQIRVHLSEAGHPLLMDPIYGRRVSAGPLADAERALGRLALHARVLGFTHPVTGELQRFCREPPADFGAALVALGYSASPAG